MAFDSAGDMWIPFCPSDPQLNGALIGAIAPAALKSIAHNKFKGIGVAAEITLPGARCPTATSFDQSGNLWISNSGRGATPAIVEYAASNLFSTDAQPAVVLTSNTFNNLQGLSFDPQGDLWIADEGGGVYEFTPGQLVSTGSPIPQLTLQSTFLEPNDVAFDGSGNLWVTYLQGPPLDPLTNNLSNGAAVKFALADLAGSGDRHTGASGHLQWPHALLAAGSLQRVQRGFRLLGEPLGKRGHYHVRVFAGATGYRWQSIGDGLPRNEFVHRQGPE